MWDTHINSHRKQALDHIKRIKNEFYSSNPTGMTIQAVKTRFKLYHIPVIAQYKLFKASKAVADELSKILQRKIHFSEFYNGKGFISLMDQEYGEVLLAIDVARSHGFKAEEPKDGATFIWCDHKYGQLGISLSLYYCEPIYETVTKKRVTGHRCPKTGATI